jgi:Fur family peroxide stress response transcriptional regulator
MSLPPNVKNVLDRALNQGGLRSTRQREHIFEVILEARDHPTAESIYARARESMPSLSLATVYNCLETLVDCQLVRQVNFERQPTRYCPVEGNAEHFGHFHCRKTGRILDVDLPDHVLEDIKAQLPAGFKAEKIEICIVGETDQTRSA